MSLRVNECNTKLDRSCKALFLFKQKTADEVRISDWSANVCSSDLPHSAALPKVVNRRPPGRGGFLEKTGGRTKGETAQIPPQEIPQQLSGRSSTWHAKGPKWRCTGALEDEFVAAIFILSKASRPLSSKRNSDDRRRGQGCVTRCP